MRIQGISWFLLQILFVAGVSTRCLDDQRLLLLQLESSLVFNRTSSTKLVKWNQSDDDCCKWDGIDCDDAGRVISLNLENETISGGIENSTALFRFQYHRSLNLAFNSFNGSLIPKGLQNLTNLEYLDLSFASFGGQVPIEVSTLRSLVVLDLSTTFLPIFYGGPQRLKLENPNLQMLVQNLSGLRGLYLDGVDLSAQSREWCQVLSSSLSNLTNLSMRTCGLSGPLDSSLTGLHYLSVLHLDGNNLSTTVPEFMARFTNLTTLTLSSCFLQGTFPAIIFQVRTLQTLDLSDNMQLSGTIQQFPLNSSFRTMVLTSTNFSGSLPISVSNARMLSWIQLSNCNFSGLIPSTISDLTQLVFVDLSSNYFTGPIPSFSLSNKLNFLDLRNNSLNGSLSHKHFEGLSNLEFIHLGSNNLFGSIPSSLFDLLSLQYLSLPGNKFSGQIAEFPISNPFVLRSLDLSSNQLEGSIPESLFKLQGLSYLYLSSNRFNGTLKLEAFQRLGNLTRLDLGYNKLSVDTNTPSLLGFPQLSWLDLASCNLYSFPNLSNQSNLVYLDLSNNHIKGKIPSWVWNLGGGELNYLNLSHNFLQALQTPIILPLSIRMIDLHSNRLQGGLPVFPELAAYIDYSSNNFHGHIPVNIYFTLKFFSVANNSLTGTIPASFCNASSLEVLQLSSNHLSGSIPPCLLGNMARLAVLNLRRNNISGEIPDAFSEFCSLRTLDLSNNKLGGSIPPSMPNCKSLEVFNVGNNEIDDSFPCWLKNTSSLSVLVLRNNKFHGDIKCSEIEESWPNLQIIDISSNHFSGQLHPEYFASWRRMVLDNNPRPGNYLHFSTPGVLFVHVNPVYYRDAVTVTLKGHEMELVKILTVFTAIDFSDNNFGGAIPQTVGELTSLYLLNLSHNAFIGKIPKTMGNLRQLGSLDLSANDLSGEIPKELADLNFLSVLNLSYNKLVGKIPTGSQFQTFPESSFEGNPWLCGVPSNKSCSSEDTIGNSAEMLKKGEYDWQLIITGVGYGVGLLAVFAPVALCKKWREFYSKQLDRFLWLLFPAFINSRDRRRGMRRMNNKRPRTMRRRSMASNAELIL